MRTIGWIIGVILYCSAKVAWWLARLAHARAFAIIDGRRQRRLVYSSEKHVNVNRGGTDFSKYEPSMPRCVQFPRVGYLTIWGYQSAGTVKRQLTLTCQSLVNKVGAHRIPLEELAWPTGISLELLEEVSVREVYDLLRKKVGLSEVEIEKMKPVQVVPGEPAHDQATCKAKPRRVEGRSRERNPGSVESARGRLEFAGYQPRTIGTETFNHFAADIDVQGVGLKRLWGVDLERALERAKVEVGDEISVEFTGTSVVQLSSGSTDYKKHFNVKRIGKARAA